MVGRRMKNGKTGNRMRQHIHHIKISLFAIILAMTSCSDDQDLSPREMAFCVQTAWQCGRSITNGTRTLTATDILISGTEDIIINSEDYPHTVYVHCSDNTDFILEKTATPCSEHNDKTYWMYTSSNIYTNRMIERGNLTFSAKAEIDDLVTGNVDILEGECSIADVRDNHILLNLHHTKALLRFAFKVDANYDRLRYIRITGITLNGTNCHIVDKVLSPSSQLIAYAYVDPNVVTTAHNNIIQCTYNIYDKDGTISEHLTREGVNATNNFRLSNLKDKDDNPIAKITAGHYYDINITLNPDYMYVLSAHDNKHLTIE